MKPYFIQELSKVDLLLFCKKIEYNCKITNIF